MIRTVSPHCWTALGVMLFMAGSLPVHAGELPAGRSLAVEMGCVNCHGAPRGDAPRLDRLAARMAGRGAEADRIAEDLRKPHATHRVVAHEQLSQETATRLIAWLAGGAK